MISHLVSLERTLHHDRHDVKRPPTDRALRSDLLEHDPDGIRKPARVMRRVRGQEEHLPLADDNVPTLPVLDDLEHHRALVLVEPFFGLVHVEIGSRVGTTDDHHGKVFAAVDAVVACASEGYWATDEVDRMKYAKHSINISESAKESSLSASHD